MTNLFVLFIFVVLYGSVDGVELKSIHVYAAGHVDGAERSGIVGFFDCAKMCHRYDNVQAVVASSAWSSLVGETVFIESTAGWLVLWRDKSFTRPLLPSATEYDTTHHDGEKGYLRDAFRLNVEKALH